MYIMPNTFLIQNFYNIGMRWQVGAANPQVYYFLSLTVQLINFSQLLRKIILADSL